MPSFGLRKPFWGISVCPLFVCTPQGKFIFSCVVGLDQNIRFKDWSQVEILLEFFCRTIFGSQIEEKTGRDTEFCLKMCHCHFPTEAVAHECPECIWSLTHSSFFKTFGRGPPFLTKLCDHPDQSNSPSPFCVSLSLLMNVAPTSWSVTLPPGRANDWSFHCRLVPTVTGHCISAFHLKENRLQNRRTTKKNRTKLVPTWLSFGFKCWCVWSTSKRFVSLITTPLRYLKILVLLNVFCSNGSSTFNNIFTLSYIIKSCVIHNSLRMCVRAKI